MHIYRLLTCHPDTRDLSNIVVISDNYSSTIHFLERQIDGLLFFFLPVKDVDGFASLKTRFKSGLLATFVLRSIPFSSYMVKSTPYYLGHVHSDFTKYGVHRKYHTTTMNGLFAVAALSAVRALTCSKYPHPQNPCTCILLHVFTVSSHQRSARTS